MLKKIINEKVALSIFNFMRNETQSNRGDSIRELLKVVSDLRHPINGCPWDIEQTHTSLIPYVIEEAYEVADAIRESNDMDFIEELGDLLLQVILHSQIAYEENRFCFDDVVKGIITKLIRRHPHVFTNKQILTSKEVNKLWDEIKSSEKPLSPSFTPVTDELKLKTRSQPSIKGAMIISKKVSKLGFEWKNINQLWEKFHEEIHEFQEALKHKNRISAQEELGDVIFTLINIARWNRINPEEGLAGTNKRFLERFAFIESKLNGNLYEQSIDKFQDLWQQAKKYIASKKKI